MLLFMDHMGALAVGNVREGGGGGITRDPWPLGPLSGGRAPTSPGLGAQ